MKTSLIRVSSLLAAGVLLVTACGKRAPENPGPPNVILITLDTLRPDHLACYGHPSISTPNLDRMAGRGTRFAEAVTVVPTTLASHLSILTGTTPRTHGVARNGFRAGDGNRTLAEVLREHGYATAAFVSAFSLDSRFNLTQGFDVYDCAYDRGFTPSVADQAQRRAQATSEAALGWLREHRTGPFFLWVHYFDPHYPYDPPGKYASLYDPDYKGGADGSMVYLDQVWRKRRFPSPEDRRHVISLYDGEISYMDEHLGNLFDSLERWKLSENSIVVVVGDHGESLGEHGYDFNHGLYVYDPCIRVPLLIRGPGLPQGRVVPELVETIDLMPTVLDLLDLPVPEVVEGRSLRPLLEGKPWSERTAFSEATKPWNVEPDSGGVFQNAWKAKCARTREWKYILTPFADKRELYDLSHDPGEETNHLGTRPDIAGEMAARLEAWTERPREIIPNEDLTPDPETLERLKALGYIQD